MGRKVGATVQHNVACAEPNSIQSGVLIHPAVWPQRIEMGRKLGGFYKRWPKNRCASLRFFVVFSPILSRAL